MQVREVMSKNVVTATPQTPIGQVAMTADRPIAGLVTITPDTDLLDAAAQLGQRRVERLPVVEQGRVVGILTAGDVSKELRRALDGLLGEGAKAADA